MSTWEERMATKAAERHRAQTAEELAAEIAADPHASHHAHLEGSGVFCSCGEFWGVTTVAIDEDYDPDKLSCDLCGQRGLVRIGGRTKYDR